jgi:hypothetical protein
MARQPRPLTNKASILTFPDLVFTNFFVGGSAWDPQDRRNIDTALAKAMSDQGLNNVLIQYFRGAANITSTFQPSALMPGDPPDTISQPEVEDLVRQLRLEGFDLERTVFNFMLPRGTVLTIDDGSGDRTGTARSEDADEKASSLLGLGGFHGWVRVGGRRAYYAVGVFSEGNNGIVAFDQPWKNVVATSIMRYARLAPTPMLRKGGSPENDETPSEEIGDIPMSLAGGNLSKVMKEVPLADGSGTVPIQLMWSNAVAGPEGPIPAPHEAPAMV